MQNQDSPAFAATPGSALWCWTAEIEAERWLGRYATKGEAMLAAQQDGATLFWVAPLVPATQEDIDNWMGEDDIELGDFLVDIDNIEEVGGPNTEVSNDHRR